MNATLENTKTQDGRSVVWKEFADRYTFTTSLFSDIEFNNFYYCSVLIMICSEYTSCDELVKVLEVIFSAMVMRVGLAELKEPKNIERLKRELKVLTNIIYFPMGLK
jgi:hypothetical protein